MSFSPFTSNYYDSLDFRFCLYHTFQISIRQSSHSFWYKIIQFSFICVFCLSKCVTQVTVLKDTMHSQLQSILGFKTKYSLWWGAPFSWDQQTGQVSENGEYGNVYVNYHVYNHKITRMTSKLLTLTVNSPIELFTCSCKHWKDAELYFWSYL